MGAELLSASFGGVAMVWTWLDDVELADVGIATGGVVPTGMGIVVTGG